MKQVFNPLKYWCAPNQATPEYVASNDFRQFLAYGLLKSWLSSNPKDPNEDCHFDRKITRDDVAEIRGHFLDTMELLVGYLWSGALSPGHGDVEAGSELHHTISVKGRRETGTEPIFSWYVRLDADSAMVELACTGADSLALWFNYPALNDRAAVRNAIAEARAAVFDREDRRGHVETNLIMRALELDPDIVFPEYAEIEVCD